MNCDAGKACVHPTFRLSEWRKAGNNFAKRHLRAGSKTKKRMANGIKTRPARRMTQAELDGFLEKAADILRGNVDHSEFRGYARRYARGTNVVVLEPDVAKVFPSAEAVNRSLRALANIIRQQKKPLAAK